MAHFNSSVYLCIWPWNSRCSRPRRSPLLPFAPPKTLLPFRRWCHSRSGNMHTSDITSRNACVSMLPSLFLVVPVLPVVWGCQSQTLGQHFSTQQRCSETHLFLHSTPRGSHSLNHLYWFFFFSIDISFMFLVVYCASTPLTCRRRWSLERWANTLNSSWE